MPRVRTTLLLPLAAVIAACGQKGDLYLPSEEREPVASLPAGVLNPGAASREEEDQANGNNRSDNAAVNDQNADTDGQ